MNKILKTALALTLTAVLAAGLALTAFALPINSGMEDNYFYNENDEAVAAPLAYRPVLVKSAYDLGLDTNFSPQDMFVHEDNLYILDSTGNRILVLDRNYSLVKTINRLYDTADYTVPDIDATTYNEDGTTSTDATLARADKYSFNDPRGLFIDDDGLIYVADYGNRRIVVCDTDGNCHQVYQSVRISYLGSSFIFRPLKVVLDNTGFLNVIAYGVNSGLVRMSADDGTFDSFFGRPEAGETDADWITDFAEEISGTTTVASSVAAEYVNVTIDGQGFIYVTAYPSDTNGAKPLKKLSADGSDVLYHADEEEFTVGDLDTEEYPQIIDVAINEEADTYTVLDARTCRFFTYNSEGVLLYIGGGVGRQYGRLRSPTSIVCWDDQVIVCDNSNKCFTVYEFTDYAQTINQAMADYNARDYDAAVESWQNVARYNSNMFLAYKTLGDIDLLLGQSYDDDDPLKFQHISRALEYFKLAQDKDGYSSAYAELRDILLSRHFTLIFGTIIIFAVGIYVLVKVRKYRAKRREEQRRAGLV